MRYVVAQEGARAGAGGRRSSSDRAHRAGNLGYSRRLAPDPRLDYYRVSWVLLDHIPRVDLCAARVAHRLPGGVRVRHLVHPVLRVLALGPAGVLAEPGQLDDGFCPCEGAAEGLGAGGERDEDPEEDRVCVVAKRRVSKWTGGESEFKGTNRG